jgi:hypothetical protein
MWNVWPSLEHLSAVNDKQKQTKINVTSKAGSLLQGHQANTLPVVAVGRRTLGDSIYYYMVEKFAARRLCDRQVWLDPISCISPERTNAIIASRKDLVGIDAKLFDIHTTYFSSP